MAKEIKYTFELPVLRVLENEHHYLSYKMGDWHRIVLGFEQGAYTVETGRHVIQMLYKKMVECMDPLKNHMEKEEKYLFPMLAKYVGDEQGPIYAAKQEHEEINLYIDHFLHNTNRGLNHLTMEEMNEIARNAGEIYEVLTFHFIKESSLVFPMVDDVLTKEEQDRLFNQIYSSIVDLWKLL